MKHVYMVEYKADKDISLSKVEAEIKTDLTEGVRRAELIAEPVYTKETVIEDKKEVEITVDNKESVAAEIVKALDKVTDYRVKVHECRHDEAVNTPCGNWQAVAEKGKLLEVKQI